MSEYERPVYVILKFTDGQENQRMTAKDASEAMLTALASPDLESITIIPDREDR